jgi:hypothetical protein
VALGPRSDTRVRLALRGDQSWRSGRQGGVSDDPGKVRLWRLIASPTPIGHANNWGDVDNWRTSARMLDPEEGIGQGDWLYKTQQLICFSRWNHKFFPSFVCVHALRNVARLRHGRALATSLSSKSIHFSRMKFSERFQLQNAARLAVPRL